MKYLFYDRFKKARGFEKVLITQSASQHDLQSVDLRFYDLKFNEPRSYYMENIWYLLHTHTVILTQVTFKS